MSDLQLVKPVLQIHVSAVAEISEVRASCSAGETFLQLVSSNWSDQ
jgi:hypothetical protein